MRPERRHLTAGQAGIQLRAADDDTPAVIVGTAAVYFRQDDPDTEFVLYESQSERYVERIAPGAFDDTLQADVRALFNHNPDHLLGRASSKTLRLRTDKTGLHYEIDDADTTAHRDLRVRLERGDVDGSSFAFLPTSVSWDEREEDGRMIMIRTIKSVDLIDVGPVTFPAYAGTSAGTRSIGDDGLALVRQELEHYQRRNGVATHYTRAARARRLRLLDITSV